MIRKAGGSLHIALGLTQRTGAITFGWPTAALIAASTSQRMVRFLGLGAAASLASPGAPKRGARRFNTSDATNKRKIGRSRAFSRHAGRGHNVIEVTNSCAQSSHDQAWRIRPLRLNSDTSAINRTLPQRGHFGRLKSGVTGSLAVQANSLAVQANWMLIVDPPRRSDTAPRCCHLELILCAVCGAAATPL